MNIIVIAGMPASGKSTVSKKISKEFGFPILEKDAIKEEIFDTIGFSNYSEKRKCDHAANAVLLRCAQALLESGNSMILDNNFDTESAKALDEIVRKYNCNCITVFLGGDTEAFYHRYIERDRLHLRHIGHALQERYPPLPDDSLDYTMTREEFRQKFEARGMKEFKCSGERIDIDATDPSNIDIDDLIVQIRTFMRK